MPGLLGLALEERGEVGDLLELAGVQGRGQAGRAGRRQQRLRLLDVHRPLGDGAVEVGVALPDDMVVAQLGPTLEQLLDERRSIEGVGEGLADLLLGEGARVGPHPDLAVEGRRLGDEAEVRVIEERRTGQDVELDDGVDLVALVGGDHRPGRIEEDPFRAIKRRLAAPPGVVPLERRAGLLVVRLQLPGAGPGRALVELGPCDVVDWRDERLRVVDRDEVREVPVRADEREGHGVGVGRDRATGVEDALEAGVAGRDEALHRGDDIGRR